MRRKLRKKRKNFKMKGNFFENFLNKKSGCHGDEVKHERFFKNFN